MQEILNILGLKDASGDWYLWWSGIFPDFVIFGGLIGWYYHHTCHVESCHRPGFHKVDFKGTPISVCRKHHPNLAPRRIPKAELHKEFAKVVHKKH